jgi:hypothetical protein
MKLTFRDTQLAIFDDVLTVEQYSILGRFLQTLEYESVHEKKVHGVWRAFDGNPRRGKDVVFLSGESAEAGGPSALRESGLTVYPTGTPMDAPLDALVGCLPELAELVGHQGRDWYGFKARSWLYPAGTRLSWHDDAEVYTGSFVYYTHPVWSAVWGGELLIANEAVRIRRAAQPPPPLSDSFEPDEAEEGRDLMLEGFGRYLFPKPNRLVVIAGAVSHMITQVSAAAGSNVRSSLGGFFLRKPKDAEGLLDLLFGPKPP